MYFQTGVRMQARIFGCLRNHFSMKMEKSYAKMKIRGNYLFNYKRLYSASKPHISENATSLEWQLAKPYQSIPGPKGLPFIGNKWRFLPVVGEYYSLDLIDINKRLFEKYGKIARLSGTSLTDIVMVYQPEDFEYLYRNEGAYPQLNNMSLSLTIYKTQVRKDVYGGFIGVGEKNGKEWQEMRRKFNPIFMQPNTVNQYIPVFDSIANQFLHKMKYFANFNSLQEMPEDFIQYLNAWTLESILAVYLDKQLGCLDINLSEKSDLSKLVQCSAILIQLLLKIDFVPKAISPYKTKSWQRFIEVMDYITFYLLEHIEDAVNKLHTNEATNKNSIIAKLLDASFNKQEVIITAISLIMAGVETTSKMIASSLYYLAKSPEVQNKLREELCGVLPNKSTQITKQTIANASYLKAVVKEVGRLAPSSGVGLFRVTPKDMVICGYQIPKGTKILMSQMLSSRSDQYFQPNEFLPERWLRTTTGQLSTKSAHRFLTLPFGFGPRICLGKRLANLMLEIGIAKIIRNFNLEWHHNDMNFKMCSAYGPADPLKLRVYEVEE